MLNIILFGPPGAGKGTQSAKLIDKYKLVHISTGDIFRANIKNATELGLLAQSYMDNGQLVPDDVTIGMLSTELNRHTNANGFIFDGFPRTNAQAAALDRLLASKGTSITLMLALEVEEEELKKRLFLRGQESGRLDDQDLEIIKKRISVYNSETAPVKEYYAAQGKYRGVYGIGDIDAIFRALCAEINGQNLPATTVEDEAKEEKTASVKTVEEKEEKAEAPVRSVSKKAAKKKPAKKVVKKTVKKAAKKASAKKKPVKKKPSKPAKKKVVKTAKKKVKPAKKAVKKKTSSKKAGAKKATKKVVKKAKAAKKTVKVKKAKPSKKKAVKKSAKKKKR